MLVCFANIELAGLSYYLGQCEICRMKWMYKQMATVGAPAARSQGTHCICSLHFSRPSGAELERPVSAPEIKPAGRPAEANGSGRAMLAAGIRLCCLEPPKAS